MTMPPPGPRRCRGRRWSSSARQPVFQKMMSACWCVPSAQVTPSGVIRSNIGRRSSTPLVWASRTARVRVRPVTLTTLAGGRPARTALSTSATAARPRSGLNMSSLKIGGLRVTQVVLAATLATSISSCTADVPPPTTTTRLTGELRGTPVVDGVQLAAGERFLARVVREERVSPGAGRVDHRASREVAAGALDQQPPVRAVAHRVDLDGPPDREARTWPRSRRSRPG